ncbi:MAG: hypothetical protein HY898_24980 [Deltaproteobacteria bacterium]|jgi:hypothetical protein|nr:hypothetical protein [Deltaproteobacteria bacterium]
METMLVRLKPYDPRRGHVLRRFTYAGVKIHEERGWHRVTKAVADYLRGVHQVANDEYSPLAFDVCTDEEAKALDVRDEVETKVRRSATDDVRLSPSRNDGVLTTAHLGEPAKTNGADPKGRKDRG